MLIKDEYGQVHNTPETYTYLADQVRRGPQIFSWVDERMSRFTVMLYLSPNPERTSPINTLLYVGVEGYGFFGFPCHQQAPGYVAKALKLALGSAEPLADLLNGVLGEMFQWPKTLEQVFAEAEEPQCLCELHGGVFCNGCPVHDPVEPVKR